MKDLAKKVIRVCRDLALCTEEPGRTTRTFLSPPMHDVHRILGDWMREIGMEWLFRFLQEPRRMWRRYFVGNVVFLWHAWRRRGGTT